jgi:hypothetical protein
MTNNQHMEYKDEYLPIIHELVKKLPNIWVGYILAAIFLAVEFVSYFVSPEKSLLVVDLLYIPIVFYFFWCIARFHIVLRTATFNEYPIGAAKAVGFHFIPLFNIYWVFRWPHKIATFVNKKQNAKIMANWLGIFLFLGGVLLKIFGVAIGTTVCFSVLFYIHRKLQKFFSMSYFYQSLKDQGETDRLSIKTIKTKIKPLSRESDELNAALIIAIILSLGLLMTFERHFAISCKYFSPKEGISSIIKLDIHNTSKRNKAENYTKAIIGQRAKHMGVRCVRITSNNDGNIFVEFPGVKDARKVERILMQGYLEFKLLDESSDPETALKGNPPPGSQVLFQIDEDQNTQLAKKIPYLVKKRTTLTGEHIVDAKVMMDSTYGTPYVSIRFDDKGGEILASVTGENVNKRLAIVVDNRVYSAPVIREKIFGGRAQIVGNFTVEEARALSTVLKYGPLPGEVEVVEVTQFHENK